MWCWVCCYALRISSFIYFCEITLIFPLLSSMHGLWMRFVRLHIVTGSCLSTPVYFLFFGSSFEIVKEREREHDKARCIHSAFCENVRLSLSLSLCLLPSPMKFKLLYSSLLHFIFFFLYFSLEYTIFASYSFGILLCLCRNSKP